MPVINVIKPFGLQLDSDRERRDFGVGMHFVSDEEFAHWFVQACLTDGRAVLVPDVADADEPEGSDEEQPPAEDESEGSDEEQPPAADETEAPAAPTREELMALTVAQLKKMAELCGLALASNATKPVIVDALLAGRENG